MRDIEIISRVLRIAGTFLQLIQPTPPCNILYCAFGPMGHSNAGWDPFPGAECSDVWRNLTSEVSGTIGAKKSASGFLALQPKGPNRTVEPDHQIMT